MKRILPALVVAGLFIGCDNDKDKPSSTESAPASSGINNVNGNLPDTSGSIKLNQPLPKDSSSVVDSVQR